LEGNYIESREVNMLTIDEMDIKNKRDYIREMNDEIGSGNTENDKRYI
jgi:hypothetical protein